MSDGDVGANYFVWQVDNTLKLPEEDGIFVFEVFPGCTPGAGEPCAGEPSNEED